MKAVLALRFILGGSLGAFDERPATPCCAITGIDAARGMVTAADNATGRSFQFEVVGAAVLHGLEIGQGSRRELRRRASDRHSCRPDGLDGERETAQRALSPLRTGVPHRTVTEEPLRMKTALEVSLGSVALLAPILGVSVFRDGAPGSRVESVRSEPHGSKARVMVGTGGRGHPRSSPQP